VQAVCVKAWQAAAGLVISNGNTTLRLSAGLANVYGATPGWLCTNRSRAAILLTTVSIFLDDLGESGWQAICKTVGCETVLPGYRASTPVFFCTVRAVLLSWW